MPAACLFVLYEIFAVLLCSAEIFYSALEQLLILFKRGVEIQIIALALGMSHFAQNSAVRAGDAFDCADRTVGIECNVAGGLALEVNILGRDLSVLYECIKHLIAYYKTSLAM